MTLSADLEFADVELRAVLDILRSAAEPMRPTHSSIDEASNREPTSADLMAARSLGPNGGYLWAPDCSYNFRVREGRPCSLFMLSDNMPAVQEMVTQLSDLNVYFGYACELEERQHRNRITKKMGYGTIETWVGRNFTRHLPGLYWLTIIPEDLRKRLGIPLVGLQMVAKEVTYRGTGNLLVRLYGNPHAWRNEHIRVDEWCSQIPGCFSKSEVENSLTGRETFLEASDLLDKWR